MLNFSKKKISRGIVLNIGNLLNMSNIIILFDKIIILNMSKQRELIRSLLLSEIR